MISAARYRLILVLAALLVLLPSCSTIKYRHVGILHDYVFTHAKEMCEPYHGVHYIVVDALPEEYCTRYKVRCNDGQLFAYDSGVEYCGIQETQLEDTLKERHLYEFR